MVDVVSALGVASLALSFTSKLLALSNGIEGSPYQTPKKILAELPVLLSLLNDIKESTIHSVAGPTQSVTVAMEICIDRFNELKNCLAKMGINPHTGMPLSSRRKKLHYRVVLALHMDTGVLQEATKRFRSALTLLRDIAME
jgi:hypothetical protein